MEQGIVEAANGDPFNNEYQPPSNAPADDCTTARPTPRDRSPVVRMEPPNAAIAAKASAV